MIGNCLLKQRTTKNSNQTSINGKMNGQETVISNGNGEHFSNGSIYPTKLPKQSKLSKEKNEDTNVSDSPFYGNFSSSFKKAYTIAGSMPSFLRKFSQNGYSPKEITDKTKFNIDTPSPAKKILIPNDENKTADCSSQQANKSTKMSSINIILCDLMVLFAALMVFFSDLTNLINDSDFVNDRIDNQTTIKNDFALFQFLLNFYKYNMTVLFFILLLTIHLSYKR
jgi:hypothetical protein